MQMPVWGLKTATKLLVCCDQIFLPGSPDLADGILCGFDTVTTRQIRGESHFLLKNHWGCACLFYFWLLCSLRIAFQNLLEWPVLWLPRNQGIHPQHGRKAQACWVSFGPNILLTFYSWSKPAWTEFFLYFLYKPWESRLPQSVSARLCIFPTSSHLPPGLWHWPEPLMPQQQVGVQLNPKEQQWYILLGGSNCPVLSYCHIPQCGIQSHGPFWDVGIGTWKAGVRHVFLTDLLCFKWPRHYHHGFISLPLPVKHGSISYRTERISSHRSS